MLSSMLRARSAFDTKKTDLEIVRFYIIDIIQVILWGNNILFSGTWPEKAGLTGIGKHEEKHGEKYLMSQC